MAVVHSNESWEDYILHWPRLKRELLNVIELAKQRQRQQADVPGANFFPVPFRNDSGEIIPAYAVMRITGAANFQGIPAITVAKPSGTFKRHYLVNGPLPVAADSTYGPNFGTWAEQSSYVLYDDASTPAEGEEWGPSNGSWKIKKYRYGFHILGGATGGDTDWVGCRQTVVNEFYGQTTTTHNKGSAQTVTLYDGNNASATDTIPSVQNRYGNVATGKKVTVRYHGGLPQIVSAECP